MSRGGWGRLFLFLLVSIVFLLLLGISEVPKPKPVEVNPEEVEEVFRACYIPVYRLPLPVPFYQYMSQYCDNPFLSKIDFAVSETLTFVKFRGQKLHVVEIEPDRKSLYGLYDSESRAICSAFRKIAEEIRKRGGYAVTNCYGTPTLKVAIPPDRDTAEVRLIKLLPEKGGP